MTKKKYSDWDKKDLIKEIEQLRKRKKYGLVWEEKLEDVVEQCKKELPVLEEVKDREINNNPDKPVNLLIEGDNYHALSVLNYTHKGKIDVIYIDPPYNTGSNSWIYNNNYVDGDDPWRHSKWLSMMEKRLRLAKRLLSKDGILIATIDDYELFSLGLLIDEIFEEKNRIGIVVVEVNPRGRTVNNFFATSHEYALFYARDASKAKIYNLPLTPEQEGNFGLEDGVSRYRLLPFRRSGGLSTPKDRPNSEFFLLFSPKTNKIIGLGGERKYDYKQKYEPKEIFLLDDEGQIRKDISSNVPETSVKIYPIDSEGNRRVWRWSDRQKILEASHAGDLVVKNNRGTYAVYLKDRIKEGRKPKTVWIDPKYDASSHGTNLLKTFFKGRKVFDYPKSLYTTKDAINAVAKGKKNACVLDFFAGSGTTGHAVLEMNKDDNGNRRFILSTNNENNNGEGFKIASDVCYPRIKGVIKGYKKGGEKIVGLGGNLKYLQTSFVPADPTDKNKTELTEKATEMLCIREDTFELVKESRKYKIYRNKDHHTGIIYDQMAIGAFKNAAEEIDSLFSVYIFSLGDDTFDDEFIDMKDKVTLSPIPEAILRVYRRIFK